VLTQTVVQEVFWLHQAVEEMKVLWFPAYFVARGSDESLYFIVIPVTKEFRERFDSAWRRLAKDRELVLLLRSGKIEVDEEKSVEWYGLLLQCWELQL
jgi:hypothetical protein